MVYLPSETCLPATQHRAAPRSSLGRPHEFSMFDNAGLCAPSTTAFRSWMEGMAFPDYHINRSLCSEDREALLGMHDALDGSNWTDSNWGDDTDIRSWRGVTLDSDVRVTELRLADSGLSGELPTVLADIDRLKVLVLEGNGLVGEVPEAVMELDLDVFWSSRRARLAGHIRVWPGRPGCIQREERS